MKFRADGQFGLGFFFSPKVLIFPVVILLTLAAARARAQAPANDDFTNRIVLSGSSVIMEGSTGGATREADEPIHAVYGIYGSVWWSWTAPSNGIAEIANLPGGEAQIVAVYEGDSLATLQEVTSDSAVWYQEAFFQAVAGHTYQIAVTHRIDGAFPIELGLTLYDSPPNDNFADRLPVVIGVTNDACNIFATMESGEPPVYYGHRTLWWTFMAPAAGRFTLQRFEPALAELFSGTNLDALTDVGTGPIDMQAGDVLQIQVDEDSYPGNPPHGHVKFFGQFDLVPANDDFANRAVLSGLPVETNGTIYLATSEPGEPMHLKQPPMNTVWYQWTAPSNSLVSLIVDASWGTTVLAVYTGNSLSTLGQIAGGFYAGEPVTFKAVAGRTYNIVIGTTWSAGPFHLAVLGPPPNDDFADAETLSGWNAESNSWTAAASMEAGEKPLTRYDSRQSIWWNWQAPYSGLVNLTARSRNPVLLGVYVGDTVSRLQLQPLQDYYPANYVTTASFWAAAGTVYHLRASGVRVVQDKRLTTLNGRVDLTVTANTLQASIAGGTQVFNWPENVTVDAQTIAEGLGYPEPMTFTVQRNSDSYPTSVAVYGPPWECTFTNLAPGVYRVTVSGTDSNGVQVFSAPISIRVKPPNDDFANRIALLPTPSAANGTFAGATLESGEPMSASETASLWYTWTPTNDATFKVTVYSGRITIYDGDSLGDLQPLKRFSLGTTLFNAASNHTYQIRASTTADPEDADSTYFAFFAQMRTNDAFAKRAVLTGSNAVFVSDNSAATEEPGEPGPNGPSLWWTWQAPAEGVMVLTRTNPAPSSISFSVYSGQSLKTLETVPSVYDLEETNRSGIVVPVHAGTNYQIATYVFDNLAAHPVPMALRFVPASTNDNFADAISLTGTNLLLTGANYLATRETGEPGRGVGVSSVGATLWWRWTANADGVATVQFVSGTIHPFVEMFDGTSVDALTSLIPNSIYFSVPDAFTFTVQAGHTYSISVGSVGSKRGEFTMQLNPVAPPVNDDFTNAITVSGTSASLSGCLYNSTREASEPTPWEPYGTVWYRWTAPANGSALIESSGVMASSVYTGTSLTNLTPVYEQVFDGYPPSFSAVAGTTYDIAVSSYLAGWFSVPLTLFEAP